MNGNSEHKVAIVSVNDDSGTNYEDEDEGGKNLHTPNSRIISYIQTVYYNRNICECSILNEQNG